MFGGDAACCNKRRITYSRSSTRQSTPFWSAAMMLAVRTSSLCTRDKKYCYYKQVFLRQLTTWHCPHSAPHAAAEARLLLGTGRAAIDRHLLPAGPTAANPQQRRAAAEWDRRTNGDRQTDGRTPDRYTDPASYTIRVVPINKLMI